MKRALFLVWNVVFPPGPPLLVKGWRLYLSVILLVLVFLLAMLAEWARGEGANDFLCRREIVRLQNEADLCRQITLGGEQSILSTCPLISYFVKWQWERSGEDRIVFSCPESPKVVEIDLSSAVRRQWRKTDPLAREKHCMLLRKSNSIQVARRFVALASGSCDKDWVLLPSRYNINGCFVYLFQNERVGVAEVGVVAQIEGDCLISKIARYKMLPRFE